MNTAGARERLFGSVGTLPRPALRAGRQPLAWLGRAVLYAALLMLLVLGARDLLRTAPSASPASPAPAWAQAAEAYASRFAREYLTFDASAQDRYKARVAPYLPDGADPMLGWDGQGKQTVAAALPAGLAVSGDRAAVVTVAVLLDGGRWEYLAVPVVVGDGAFVVASTPALVPPPARAEVSAPSTLENDPALASMLTPTMTSFFAAYGAADATQLSYYATPGARLNGVGGLTLAALVSLRLDQRGGDSRAAEADVRWSDGTSGASLVQSYALRLTRVEGRWYVASIGPGIGLGPATAGAAGN